MSLFEKTFELSLTASYVVRWGLVEAARELIQNALDSESPFVYDFVREPGGTAKLLLRSEFTTLSPKTLLLGATSKADSPDSIGSFGEGYKIALLVLTRLERPVTIRNGDKVWRPEFRWSDKFGEKLLVIRETSASDRHTGLTFEVGGLGEEEVDAIRASCLQMQPSPGELKMTSFGDILLERPGHLYVGGLFICKTDLEFGYNIKPEKIKLERDRQTVSSFDLKLTTREMWFETKEFDRIAALISEGAADLEYARYDSPELVKEACYQHFRREHPGAIAAANQGELNELVARGMERVVVVSSGAYYASITESASYKSEVQIAVETVEQRLKRWLSKNRKYMRTEAIVEFKSLIVESSTWKRK